jgi:hypothetical protein
MLLARDPMAIWYAWRSRSALRFDPQANYEFGLKIGQRLAIEQFARDMGSGADLTGVDGSGHGGVQTAHAVPDLTVESSAAQVGN